MQRVASSGSSLLPLAWDWSSTASLRRSKPICLRGHPNEKKGSMDRSVKVRIPRFRRFTNVQLLVALALLFFFFPFVEEVKGGDIIVSILLSLVLLCAVLAVADRKRVFFIALVLAIPAIAGRWISPFRPGLVPPPVFLTAGLVLIAFVVANLLDRKSTRL